MVTAVPLPDTQDSAAPPRWLSVVGISEDGVAGLTPVARGLVSSAEIVFGTRQQLGLAASLIRGAARPWLTSFDGATAQVLSHRDRQICVLASGNPFHHGVSAVLARRIDAREMTVVPTLSAFSVAAAKLGWSLTETVLLAMDRRPPELVHPHLRSGARILAFTPGGDGPRAMAALLRDSGFGASRLTVLESLGTPHERIRGTTAAEFPFGVVDALNTVAIEIEETPGARVPARIAGLADSLFEHDGRITKREIRALIIGSLAPYRGELLWDIGAGAGSVAIEWMLGAPTMRAIAVERDAERAARICRNAAAFGVPQLQLIDAAAPAALTGLPAPDAIFIGGGGDTDVLDTATRALRPRGRLVANAATVKSETALLMRHGTLGGELTRIATGAGAPGGESRSRPVLQWVWTKP